MSGDGEPEVIESYTFGSGVKTKVYEAKVGHIFCGLALDATSLFITSTEAGRVRRIRKPAN